VNQIHKCVLLKIKLLEPGQFHSSNANSAILFSLMFTAVQEVWSGQVLVQVGITSDVLKFSDPVGPGVMQPF
jgi:hypothetical protein